MCPAGDDGVVLVAYACVREEAGCPRTGVADGREPRARHDLDAGRRETCPSLVRFRAAGRVDAATTAFSPIAVAAATAVKVCGERVGVVSGCDGSALTEQHGTLQGRTDC